MLEGPHLVGEALDAGVKLEWVLATPEFAAGREAQALFARLASCKVELVNRSLLAEVADSDTPQGLLAAARLAARALADLPRRADGLYLFLDRLQDPGNLGAIARVAEAAGAVAMALAPGSVHPTHPRALRASAGSLLRLPWAIDVEASDLEATLAGARPRWVALVPSGGSDLFAADLGGCLLVALGAEGPGLSRELDRRAELRLTIPLAAPVESLNVAVAAAVVLFERRRQLGGGR